VVSVFQLTSKFAAEYVEELLKLVYIFS